METLLLLARASNKTAVGKNVERTQILDQYIIISRKR